MSQQFGGIWTSLKLELVNKYFSFYTTCLKNTPFKLLYIDAFAGSGDCQIKTATGIKTIDGSARLALKIDPPFHEHHFIEVDDKNFTMLEEVVNQFPDANVHLYHDDANDRVKAICRETDWRGSRAVMFLDPFGMEVSWETLVEIANTKAVDLWYLFPLSGLYRQAAHDLDKVDAGKAAKLDLLLGRSDWRTEMYSQSSQKSLFEEDNDKLYRDKDVKGISEYIRNLLRTIFASVPEPRILPEKGPPRYALFFAVANPKAATLSLRGAKHILKMQPHV